MILVGAVFRKLEMVPSLKHCELRNDENYVISVLRGVDEPSERREYIFVIFIPLRCWSCSLPEVKR